MSDQHSSPLKHSGQDLEALSDIPSTPQTESPAYRLAFADEDFMRRDEVRGVRLQVELLKPDLILDEHNVASTVVMFGGARLPEPGVEPWAGDTDEQRENLRINSKYYEQARLFAQRVSKASQSLGGREFVVVTGGGPGVMEAGNRGANDVGARSIGLGIVLEREPVPNAYVSPEFCFNFHYFAVRKMHFLLRAKAVSIFPGGFGTLDELFETLTLIQTGRMARIPVLLFGEEFWRSIINFDALVAAGTIGARDLELFSFVETAEEGWAKIAEYYDVDV